MEHFISQFLEGATGGGAYLRVLVVLLLCGMGLPLPEDVVLITGGYLVFNEAAHLGPMLLTGFAGILLGDSIMFFLGRYLGDFLVRRWPFNKIFTPAKRQTVEGLFAKYGEKIVMIARFMPGVRAVTFFSAGTAGMKYSHFVFFDGLAALISAPVFICLGWYFGSDIQKLIQNVRKGQPAVLGTIGVALLVYLLVKSLRSRRKVRLEKASAALPDASRSTSSSATSAPGAAPIKSDARATE